jgi:hypothetical protein
MAPGSLPGVRIFGVEASGATDKSPYPEQFQKNQIFIYTLPVWPFQAKLGQARPFETGGTVAEGKKTTPVPPPSGFGYNSIKCRTK